jgi:SulP family sulfate permease
MRISYLSRNDFPKNKSEFSSDIAAGLTVAIVALPLAIGFAVTTGMSAASGIITAIIAGFIAALFGGSRYQVSGPTGAMTVVLIPIVTNYGAAAIPALGLMAGVIVVIAAIFKAGSVINRVPWAVVEGFTVGIALVIALQQIPLALDFPKGGGDRTYIVAWHTLSGAFNAGLNWKSIGAVIFTLLIKFNYPKIAHRYKFKVHIPASIIAIALTTMASLALNLNLHAIGDIPRSIGTWSGSLVDVKNLSHLILPAFLIAVLAAIESLLSARVADGMVHAKDGDKYDPNKELVGQGLATIAASLFGGMPATGAIARTSVNVRNHAKTRVAAMVHAVILLLIVILFAPLVSAIPTVAIAGVLIGTSYRILNPASLRESLQTTKSEAFVLVITALVTLFIDLIWGIAIGIIAHFITSWISRRN